MQFISATKIKIVDLRVDKYVEMEFYQIEQAFCMDIINDIEMYNGD